MPRTTTIGNVISRIRDMIKATKQDSFITNRFIYNLVLKHGHMMMRREDGKNKLLSFSSAIQSLDAVELIEVDKIEACCVGLKTGCTIKRTKEKVPLFMEGYYGPLVRSITSVDGSEELQPTIPSSYLQITNSSTFKYNKSKYFWYLNEHLYFPDLEWDFVRIEGIFQDDVAGFTCSKADDCTSRLEQYLSIPDYLLSEVENLVMRDLTLMIQVPPDPTNDKQSTLR